MANSTAQNLKDSIASTQEVKANLGSAVTAAKEGKIQVGAVIRLIALIIAWLNQLAVTFGTYTIPT
uniref:hypothetical protein n=1 Tax=Turicimonas muris TaxID=1796652 RepID=UPI0032203EDA